jgi:hypothetical protein
MVGLGRFRVAEIEGAEHRERLRCCAAYFSRCACTIGLQVEERRLEHPIDYHEVEMPRLRHLDAGGLPCAAR